MGESIFATLHTTAGPIRIELFPNHAPRTVANFVGLATGQIEWQSDASTPKQKKPFYDGLGFHRVVTDFIIQTGNPTGKYNAGPGWRLGWCGPDRRARPRGDGPAPLSPAAAQPVE